MKVFLHFFIWMCLFWHVTCAWLMSTTCIYISTFFDKHLDIYTSLFSCQKRCVNEKVFMHFFYIWMYSYISIYEFLHLFYECVSFDICLHQMCASERIQWTRLSTSRTLISVDICLFWHKRCRHMSKEMRSWVTLRRVYIWCICIIFRAISFMNASLLTYVCISFDICQKRHTSASDVYIWCTCIMSRAWHPYVCISFDIRMRLFWHTLTWQKRGVNVKTFVKKHFHMYASR